MFSKPEIDTWWKNVLGSPKYVVAPMVDASEAAWRILSRKYNAQLCFTPMIHAKNFVQDYKYRKENLPQVLPEDKPLIAQFCGNDPSILVEAARLVKDVCDGVDINLGCPQTIAKRGNYGAFLQDNWSLLDTIVRRLTTEVEIPISCKIRVFEDIDKTVRYAKMLESAGAWMLTVHGRRIDQKGMLTGIASWEHIKAVKEAVKVPVIANGNIQYLSDVHRCIDVTGVDGVMSAEGNLHNPAIFTGQQHPVWRFGLEYIELARKYKCPLSFSRGHLFKLYHHLLQLQENEDLRMVLGKGTCLEEFEDMSLQLKQRYEPFYSGEQVWAPAPNPNDTESVTTLLYPPWICQPYVRQPSKSSTKENSDMTTNILTNMEVGSPSLKETPAIILHPSVLSARPMSKKLLKKLARFPAGHKAFMPKSARSMMDICNICVNPRSAKCDFKCCKTCCHELCYRENLDCVGHKFLVKSRRYEALKRARNIVEESGETSTS